MDIKIAGENVFSLSVPSFSHTRTLKIIQVSLSLSHSLSRGTQLSLSQHCDVTYYDDVIKTALLVPGLGSRASTLYPGLR